MSSRAGFTLIELLVVVAIIVVLSALMVPMAGRMSHKAKEADCISRLGRTGTGLSAYIADNDGAIPFGTYRSAYPGMPLFPTWEDFLISYVEPAARPMVDWKFYKKVFDCPESPAGSTTKKAMEQGGFSTSYACNTDLLVEGRAGSTPLRIGRIQRPSRNLVLVCGSKRSTIPSDKLEDPDTIGFEKHPGGANGLFLDGHVETLREETIAEAVASQTIGSRRVLRD